ncbi:hypothetical protein EV424DRAFT_1450123, partial [Suillus variegatus]
IAKRIPTIPVYDFTSDPHLIVVHSFDVNKPGAEVDDLKGGVAGDSVLIYVLRTRARSQDSCGYCSEGHSGLGACRLVSSRTVSARRENHLQFRES